MCSLCLHYKKSCLYYIAGITDWHKNLLSIMFFLFKNYSLVKVLYLLIRCCYKTRFFLWNTNNSDRNGANKQNTNTPNTQRKITLERVSKYENKWYPPFLKQPRILTAPPFSWEKSESPFFGKFQKLNPSCTGVRIYSSAFQQKIVMTTFNYFVRKIVKSR